MKLLSWKIKIYSGACFYTDLGGEPFKMNDFSEALFKCKMFVYKVRMFFPRQFHLMCSILLLYLLIVLHNCKKTHISNFMITLLRLESTNTILLPIGKTRVLLKITQSLMFLLGGFHCKFNGFKRYIYHVNM